jgi:hypothetical protein
VDDCTEVGKERDSARWAHADGSREHISKVCSQLIIGTPLCHLLPYPPVPLAAHHGKDEVPRFEARLLPRTNLHGNRPCAGAIYGGRQIAKRTGTGRTWLSMLCAQFSQLHSPLHSRASVLVMRKCRCARRERAENAIIIASDFRQCRK